MIRRYTVGEKAMRILVQPIRPVLTAFLLGTVGVIVQYDIYSFPHALENMLGR